MSKTVVRVIIIAACLAHASFLRAQWGVDTRISSANSAVTLNESMGQCLAASGDSVHIVWCNPNGNGARIFYRHSFDGGITWADDTPIPGTPANTGFPSVSVSGSTVHVSFRDTTGGVYTTYYVRSTDAGMTWKPVVSLGEYFWWPSITSAGTYVYVALNDKSPGNTEVYCRRSTDEGETWDTVSKISNAVGRSEDPSITASGPNVYLAWNDNRTGVMQSWYRRSTDHGMTWDPEMPISNATTFAYFPMIHAVGGQVDMVNGERIGTTYKIFFTHSDDSGKTWPMEAQVTQGPNTDSYPTIAMNGQVVDMIYSGFGASAVYLTSTNGGGTWSQPDTIAPAANKPGSTFIVSVGEVRHIIWLDSRNGFPSVYYKRSLVTPHALLEIPNQIDFGKRRLSVSSDTTLILRNGGEKSLTVVAYRLNDPHGVFELPDTTLHLVAAGGEGTIGIRFHPHQLARDSATLSSTTDDSSVAASQVSLYGSGTDTLKQAVLIRQQGLASMTVSPDPVTLTATLDLSIAHGMSDARIELVDAAGHILGVQKLGLLTIGDHSVQLVLPSFHGAIFIRLFSGVELQRATRFMME